MRWGRKDNQVYDEGVTSVAVFHLAFYEVPRIPLDSQSYTVVAVLKNFTPWSEIMLAYM
jgi:hypothetical protein